ncbi:MAG: hypothetical protein MJZ38_00760 [archaeon]|nr:hypothetical protein [archaeon]
MSSLDRSEREAANKRKAQSKERKQEKEAKKARAADAREDKQRRRDNRDNSAARYETRSMVRTMAYSAGILIIAFVVFEILLLAWKALYYPTGTDYTNDDVYWHLINIADTCVGFVIGLTAMDALTYLNSDRKAKRDEMRAIIRHNRIVKPSIDMYLARKNSLITVDGDDLKPFQVVTKKSVRDMKDMYGPSAISSDAGKAKIDAFEYYNKKLNIALLNMAEDINFDYHPELCDAVMTFLNETTYGQAALEAVVSYGKEGSRTVKMGLIRQIKEASDDMEIFKASDELNTTMIVLHMIHAQEDALEKYMRAIEEIDSSAKGRRKVR